MSNIVNITKDEKKQSEESFNYKQGLLKFVPWSKEN